MNFDNKLATKDQPKHLWTNPTEEDNLGYYHLGQLPPKLKIFIDQYHHKIFVGQFESQFQVLVNIQMNLNLDIKGLHLGGDYLEKFRQATTNQQDLNLVKGQFNSLNHPIWAIIYAIDHAKAQVLEFVIKNLDTETTMDWLKSVYFANKHQDLSKLMVVNNDLGLFDNLDQLQEIFEQQKNTKGVDIYTFLDKANDAMGQMTETSLIQKLKE